MRTILQNHNRIAYNKVMAAFETSRMTCVCHPTGTGKSYIAAAVCENFDKVLILAPNNFVLQQQESILDWHKGVDYRNYPWLIKNVWNIADKYDLIVFDEFHRTGAPEWGAAVQLLIESQPQAKILGTTATPIRYLNNDRDMSGELFDGNIASQLSIAEAWTQRILPIPQYVTGIFSFSDTVSQAKERISKSRRISDKVKRKRIYRLSNAQLEWETSIGMPGILQRHFRKDCRRVIVFCSDIPKIQEMRDLTVGWFREAGISICQTYDIHSSLTDRQQRDVMDDFENDEFPRDGVKIIFAVNILNEGVHVPGVGCVIMLRTTSSRIIYMQQLGRALTAATTDEPLILDMVDNITTTTAIKDISDEFDKLELERSQRDGDERRQFEIHDYTLSVRQMIDRLVPEEFSHLTAEERLDIVEAYVQENGHLPRQDEYNVVRHWRWLTIYAYDHPRVQALIEKYGRAYRLRLGLEKRIEAFAAFYDANRRLPIRKNGADEERLERCWLKLRKDHSDHPKVHEYMIKVKQDLEAVEQQRITDFAKKVTEVCEAGTKSLSRISEWRYLQAHHPTNPVTIELRRKYGHIIPNNKLSPEERVADIEKFCEKAGHQPRRRSDGLAYSRWRNLLKSYPDHPGVKAIIEKYPVQTTCMQNIGKVRQFATEAGRLPLPDDGKIYGTWNQLAKRHRDHPDVQALMKKYNYAPDTVAQTCKDVMEYYHKHGHAPRSRDAYNLYQRWKHVRYHNPGREDVQLVAVIFDGQKRTIQEEQRIDKYERFLEEHGHHARRKHNTKEYNLWNGLYAALPDHPRIKAIVEKYGRSYTEWKEQQKNSEYGTEETKE